MPTERTPLLSGEPSSTSSTVPTESQTEELPAVGTFAARLESEDLLECDIDKLYPPALQSRSARTAFALCTLLYYRKSQRARVSARGRDTWARWREQVQRSEATRDVDTLIARAWSLFLEAPGTALDIGEVLYTAYPVKAESSQAIRVIDFIAAGDVSDDFLRHELVTITLVDVWKYGHDSHRGRNGITATMLNIIDRCGTPRVLYLMDLVTYIVYLGIMYHFVNYPPSLTPARRTLLLLYALGKVSQPWSSSTVPPLIVLLSFVPRFPSPPIAGDFTFSTVHWAFFYEVILLHLPTQNSLLFLFQPDRVLPLAVLAWRGLGGIFTTAVYFLPGLLFSFIVFALSFSDWGPWLRAQSIVTYPPPFDTRVTLFTLFVTMLLFQCCLLVYSVSVHPFLAAYEDLNPQPWDRYTKSVGLAARRAFARQVRLYSTACYYPTPLNVVQVLLVRTPRFIVMLSGRNRSLLEKIAIVDRVLWRIVVGPGAFILSGLWLWYLWVS
ncbi:hypothetical protein OH77DRAFT_1391910 [Trametes cingulata]|nr:hypothetical protein OH77DRAFT_1391910 [Trametes cingulata]